MKSPLEMIASAIRATGADVQSASMLAQQLQQLGEPLYKKVEPTGYSSANAEWVNSAALVARMNFGLALAANRLPGIKAPSRKGGDTAADSAISDSPREVASQLLFREPSAETVSAIERA